MKWPIVLILLLPWMALQAATRGTVPALPPSGDALQTWIAAHAIAIRSIAFILVDNPTGRPPDPADCELAHAPPRPLTAPAEGEALTPAISAGFGSSAPCL